MTIPRQRYRDQVTALLDRVLAEQSDVLDAARDAVATALGSDHLVYVAGSGHSHLIAEEAFYELDAPVARVCSAEVPMPYAKHLEDAVLPQVAGIVEVALGMVA